MKASGLLIYSRRITHAVPHTAQLSAGGISVSTALPHQRSSPCLPDSNTAMLQVTGESVLRGAAPHTDASRHPAGKGSGWLGRAYAGGLKQQTV